MNPGTCLLCFAVNIKTFNIKDTRILFYKEIIDFKVEAQTYPHSLCFICRTKFQQCYNFVTQTRNIQMSYNDENVQGSKRAVEVFTFTPPPLIDHRKLRNRTKRDNIAVTLHRYHVSERYHTGRAGAIQLRSNMALPSTKMFLDTAQQDMVFSVEYPPLVQLTTVKVLNTSIPYNSVTIKQEPDVKEESSDCLKVDMDLKENEVKCDVKEAEERGNEHETTPHEKNLHKCDICNKKFSQKCNLNMHKIIHSGVKPYSCDICNKKFSQRGTLNTHKLIHTAVKPYSCDICNKKFITQSRLNRHKLNHTGVKPYSCDICNKEFRWRSSFNRHKLTHTFAKPYSCDICYKKFSERASLNTHKLTQSCVKPHSCDICNKKFSQTNSLNRHKLTHTGVKPYSCDICNKKFSLKGNLKAHIDDRKQ